MVFVNDVMAAESGHRSKRRAAAYPHLVGLLQQPFPQQRLLVPVPFVHVEAKKAAVHPNRSSGRRQCTWRAGGEQRSGL